MPGYRQILTDEQIKDYTIDNERIYNKAKAKRDAQQYLASGNSMEETCLQDIVPIESEHE